VPFERLAIKPANMTYEEAVGVCDGALTALIFLRDTANIQHGQKVLINGASGAVGAYAIQLAKYFGAEVTGVCSAVGKNLYSRCKSSLKQKGIYLSTTPTLGIMLQMLWTSKIGSKKAVFTAAGLKQSKENLVFLKNLVEAGKIKSVIDRHYPRNPASR
jgi:NADPH:quinone reductase-like Zn-dependent oxidoreductase